MDNIRYDQEKIEIIRVTLKMKSWKEYFLSDMEKSIRIHCPGANITTHKDTIV